MLSKLSGLDLRGLSDQVAKQEAPRQLTTGAACLCTDQPDLWCPRDDHARAALRKLGPPGCTCREAHGWYPGRPDDPSCPVHRRRPQPCSCRYGLYDVVGAPAPYEQLHSPGIRRPRWATRCFKVAADCPHHGDWPDVLWTAAEQVLDEYERRGH